MRATRLVAPAFSVPECPLRFYNLRRSHS
jgi:hypothetical protein